MHVVDLAGVEKIGTDRGARRLPVAAHFPRAFGFSVVAAGGRRPDVRS
jgi:hypothetical protein